MASEKVVGDTGGYTLYCIVFTLTMESSLFYPGLLYFLGLIVHLNLIHILKHIYCERQECEWVNCFLKVCKS